ncbi:kinase-like domain-containing protein [Mycena galopus ATCC 62051]|nr:kinase-like domain-containing protein [Mycena galopus ATCC 62051]
MIQRLKRETDVWSRLNHRNLLPFFGIWDERVAPGPVMISPFYKSGNLEQYLRNCPTVDKEKMIFGMASGLDYLHQHEIVHGDLKVHNVLIDKHGRPCICDFGTPKIVNSQGFSTSSVGTPPYMAPELFLVLGDIGSTTFERVSTTMSSDVYSFALLVLEILTTTALKHRPMRPIIMAQAIGSLRPRRDDYDLASVSSDFWNLLDCCWEPDPTLRPTICDVVLRLPLDASEARILSRFISTPALSAAAQSLCAIIRNCQTLAQNRFA